VSQPEIAKKITKTPILGVQDHSRSWTLTPIKSLSLLLVIIAAYLYLSATVVMLHEIIAEKALYNRR